MFQMAAASRCARIIACSQPGDGERNPCLADDLVEFMIAARCIDGWFWSGVPEPSWLARFQVPMFVSHARIAARYSRTLPRAQTVWACDSGAFSVLAKYGAYPADAEKEYAEALQRYREEIGGLIWAAPQDWMCETWILKRTGLSVTEHQRRSCLSVCRLRELVPDIHVIPVL